MKKIIIDNFVFNKAIQSRKFEVAEFLLEHECPCNYTSYLQILEVPVFEWLSSHGVQIDEPNFSLYLIEKTETPEILEWFFLVKKINISTDTMKYCINNSKIELIKRLINYGYKLKNTDYITAFKKGDLNLISMFKDNNCPFDQEVEKYVLSSGNKEVIKWSIKNGLI